MKIGIVTVYDGVSNIGSYLQAYAMQLVLKKFGHDVFFVEKTSVPKCIWRHIGRLNPKRAFFLRLCSGWNYLIASRQFQFIKPEQIQEKLDGLLFGSDEIWNMENPFFKDPLFFGTGMEIPRIAYAVSVGAMEQQTLNANRIVVQGVPGFRSILVRDKKTAKMMGEFCGKSLPIVCDPTFLVDKQELQIPIKRPVKKYMLVYSYGLDQPMIDHICRFARENGLEIVSAHFWHPFCDRTIPCKPLEFGSLMAEAEFVFTSTFHGAVFAMLNHTRCCILPVREKVRAVVEQMGQNARLVEPETDFETFSRTIRMPFAQERFEEQLERYRTDSMRRLETALACLEDSGTI